jgi:hypothetical protein
VQSGPKQERSGGHARHYAPTLGRFLQTDPLALLGSYTYVRNSPVSGIDPSGRYIVYLHVRLYRTTIPVFHLLIYGLAWDATSVLPWLAFWARIQKKSAWFFITWWDETGIGFIYRKVGSGTLAGSYSASAVLRCGNTYRIVFNVFVPWPYQVLPTIGIGPEFRVC